jgi:addiction module HigA family antidote
MKHEPSLVRRSAYAANITSSARRSKAEHHKGGHKDQNHNYRIARSMHVQQRRIEVICSQTRAIGGDTALRLERLFGMSEQAWLSLQSQYDLEVVARDLRQRIDAEVTPLTAAAA